MTTRDRPLGGLAVAVAAIALAACSRAPKDGPTVGPATVPSGAPAPSALPVDHLAQGELVEGTQTALGILLPRDLQIRETYVDLVTAVGPVSVHALARYLSARLDGGSLREGAQSATFEHVTARGKPEPELLVHLASVLGGTRLEIHKVMHPPATNGLDDDSRWRQVGLSPQGKVLDPSHLE